MNRTIHYLNTVGVIALAILCVLQWRANRSINLEANRLEKLRIEQAAQVEDLSKKLKGATDDLESFRTQVIRATGTLNETEKKLIAAEREMEQLKVQNTQLKASVTNWSEAVALREERLKEANTRIVQLSQQLNSNTVTFNKLATNYNAVVSQLDALRAAAAAPKPEKAAP